MNYLRISTALAGILLASSCDKPNALARERAALEAEFNQRIAELQSLETQFAALAAHPDHTGPPEQEHASWVKTHRALDQVLVDLSKKCTQGDDLLKKVHSKLDAYKALNAQ